MGKFVLAIDSFKGCLSSAEVELAAERGIRAVDEKAEIVSIPVSDGGEGMLEAFNAALGGSVRRVSCHDPMMRPIMAEYGIIVQAGGYKTAIIEVAQVIGLSLVSPQERNVLIATSYGVGELIYDAMQQECTHFIIGLGGSATSDCGIGMLRALINRFHGKDFNGIKEHFRNLHITLACDVQNPLYGEKGAAYVFGPQKGADEQQVQLLDRQARTFAEMSAKYFGYDCSMQIGAGAAGGLGYALMQYLDGKVLSGVELMLNQVAFDELLDNVSYVITGEGKADRQTLMGKLPFGILSRAKRRQICTILIAGQVSDQEQLLAAGFDAVLCINPVNLDIKQAMNPVTAATNVEKTLTKWLREVQSL